MKMKTESSVSTTPTPTTTAQHTSGLTVDDVKAERTWVLQHGMRELTTIGGRSYTAAVREWEKQIKALDAEIAKMEGAS